MAAEGIEKAAKARNCFIKVETRGSGGAKNVLTDQEIQEADCIIVAADAQVPMERFDGKKLIECQVSDGISKADALVERAIAGDAPVYHAAAGASNSSAAAKAGGGAGHKIYTQLMNGVSHMLPLVVGGGILIALAFLIDGLSVDLNSLPADQRANFGTITPVATVLRTSAEQRWLYASDTGRLYCHGHRRQTGSCSRSCRRNDRSKRKIRFSGSSFCRLSCRLSDPRASQNLR